MKKGLMFTAITALLGLVGLAATPTDAVAACRYEGMTWDVCNGLICPGGWCCKICDKT